MDITELILEQHHEQRRAFALLDELDEDTTALAAVWERITIMLEVHAKAEELFFYPRLLEVGTGGGDADSAADETEDAIKDHNEIRDAIAEAAHCAVGSDDWWKGVAKTDEANSDHMGEEEREDLTDFRRHASWQLRHDIAVAFATFEAQHHGGVVATDKDPKRYVEENS